MLKSPLIILPAYNVEDHIEPLLVRLEPYRDNCLFINDGSTDRTEGLIKQHGFNYINNQSNRGVSHSIISGLEYAFANDYKKVILMDADGQHDVGSIPAFTNELESFDMVFGNRFSREAISTVPSCKLASNILAASLYEEISGIFIPDVACGFKGFSISQELIEFLKSSSGYSVIYDILNYALKKQYKLNLVRTPAIYYSDSLQYTRIIELNALFHSLKDLSWLNNSSHDEILNSYIAYTVRRKDFSIESAGIQFHLFYLSNYNGYIIQAPVDEIRKKILACDV